MEQAVALLPSISGDWQFAPIREGDSPPFLSLRIEATRDDEQLAVGIVQLHWLDHSQRYVVASGGKSLAEGDGGEEGFALYVELLPEGASAVADDDEPIRVAWFPDLGDGESLVLHHPRRVGQGIDRFPIVENMRFMRDDS